MNSRFLQRPFIVAVLLLCVYVQLYFILSLFSEQAGWFSLVAILILSLFALSSGFLPANLFQQISSGEKAPSWLSHMLAQQANKLDHPRPMLQIADASGINAFATSNVFLSGRIFLQAEILRSLTHDEIESVIAHEMCHIRCGHAAVFTFVHGLTLPISLPLSLLVAGVMSFSGKGQGLWTDSQEVNRLLGLICFPLMSLVALLLTRSWEFEADRCAALLVGKEQYIETLRCLHGSFFQHPNLLGIRSGQNEQSSFSFMSLSHPDLFQRINALQEIGR